MLKDKDIRIIKTKNKLSTTIIKIMEETPFANIKITDICKLSTISRPTFYTYFNDKYELLLYTLSILTKDIQTIPYDESIKPKYYYLYISEQLITNINNHLKEYLIINKSTNKLLKSFLYETILELFNENIPNTIQNYFYLGAFTNTTIYYLDNYFTKTKEEILEQLNKIL